MAVGCPYGGEDQQGLVLIYNGYQGGLRDTPTQTLSGKWASTSSSFPAGFGYAIRGNADLDQNGYPGTFLKDYLTNKRFSFLVLTPRPTPFRFHSGCLWGGQGSAVQVCEPKTPNTRSSSLPVFPMSSDSPRMLCFVFIRARPIVNTSASLTVLPHMFNPEEKTCQVFDGNHTIATSWYRPSLHLLLWLHILC